MAVTVDYTIKLTDILGALLTSITIIVSVLTLYISLSKDRYLRQKEQADLVRSSATKVLAKLERLQAIYLSFFNVLQPIFVETSEMLIKNFDLEEARDYLWKKINSERILLKAKILDEQIETAYVELFSHFSSIRHLFTNALKQVEEEEERVFDDFLRAAQNDVFSFDGKKSSYKTAMLGNALRSTANQYSSHLEAQTNQIVKPVQDYLFSVIDMSDEKILGKSSFSLVPACNPANKGLQRNARMR